MTETTSLAEQREDEIAEETDDELVAKYIVRGPNGRGPDEASTAFGVSVWLLVDLYHAYDRSIARTAAEHALPEIAVRAALAYYRQNRALIDARILIENAIWEDP